jgi:hypothetical protein
MKHRRQLLMRVAEPGEQPLKPAKAQLDFGRVQRKGGLEQGIEHGIVGPSAVHPRAAAWSAA